jgi:hypothetical protein
MEREGNMNLPAGSQLLKPTPGFCIRVPLKGKGMENQRVFVNVCHSKLIDAATMSTAPATAADEKKDKQKYGGGQTNAKATFGAHWSVPYSLSRPRPLSADEPSTQVFDFVVATLTFESGTVEEQYVMQRHVTFRVTSCNAMPRHFVLCLRRNATPRD